jgi:hypothetical protein
VTLSKASAAATETANKPDQPAETHSMDELLKRRADAKFREGFALIFEAALKSNPELLEQIKKIRIKTRKQPDGQGNPIAARDFQNAGGWVEPEIATEVFRELSIPEYDDLGSAYAILKKAVDGHSESWYRAQRKK